MRRLLRCAEVAIEDCDTHLDGPADKPVGHFEAKARDLCTKLSELGCNERVQDFEEFMMKRGRQMILTKDGETKTFRGIAEASVYLNLSVQTLYSYIAHNQLAKGWKMSWGALPPLVETRDTPQVTNFDAAAEEIARSRERDTQEGRSALTSKVVNTLDEFVDALPSRCRVTDLEVVWKEGVAIVPDQKITVTIDGGM